LRNFTFQTVTDRLLAKKKTVFLFGESIGFKAYYDKRYYPVKSQGLTNGRKGTRLPDVTKPLLQKCYFSDGKGPG
jgi:hypothetical protein